MGAEPSLVQELIGLYQEDVWPRLTTLKQALEAGDGDTAIQEAHQLKGALSNLGLLRFAALASQIEDAARDGNWEPARSLVDALPEAYAESLAALQAAFPGT